MSLTTSLLLLGLAVVIALVLHGWWSARRASPRAADSAPAVAEGERVEPELGAAEPASPAAQEEAAVALSRRPEVRLDPLIDVLVPIALESPVAGASLLLHLSAVRRAGAKPLHAEGREVASGEWETPQLGRRYAEVQFGLQMANRSGALNEIEFSEFVQKVQAFADAIGGTPDFPDMMEVCSRARELDSLAGPLDLQLTLNLRSNAVAWSVAFIQQCASRHGFVPGALPGRLVVPGADEGAPPVLTLSFDSQAALADDPQTAPVRVCVLSLDVPQTPEDADPFASWQHAAFALAEDMDATLVDDDGRELGAPAFASIGRDLQSLYRQLEALEVPAGSPSARRLFS